MTIPLISESQLSQITSINGVSLASLNSGILKNTNGTGIPTIASAGVDYQAPLTDPLTGTGTSGQVALFSGTSTISGSNVNTAFNRAFGTSTPNMDGVGSAGSTNNVADSGHVHPSDTSRSPLAGSSSLTTVGTITSGTWNANVIGSSYGGAGTVNGVLQANGAGTVSALTQNTAFNRAFGTATPNMDGVGSAGSTNNVADSGHVHPSDTSRAALAGNNVFTGSNTFNLPIADAGWTQINITLTGVVLASSTLTKIYMKTHFGMVFFWIPFFSITGANTSPSKILSSAAVVPAQFRPITYGSMHEVTYDISAVLPAPTVAGIFVDTSGFIELVYNPFSLAGNWPKFNGTTYSFYPRVVMYSLGTQ